MSALDDALEYCDRLALLDSRFKNSDWVLEARAELEALRAEALENEATVAEWQKTAADAYERAGVVERENAKLRKVIAGCNLLNIASNEGAWKLDGELQKLIDEVMKENNAE